MPKQSAQSKMASDQSTKKSSGQSKLVSPQQRENSSAPGRETSLAKIGAASIESGIQALAKTVTGQLQPAQIGQVCASIKEAQAALEYIKKILRDQQLQMILAKGTAVTEAGTLQYEKDGWVFEAQPQASGYDSKKVEAALRAKSADVNKYMIKEVKYKADVLCVTRAVEDKLFTADEIELLKHDLDYRVMPPKKVENE